MLVLLVLVFRPPSRYAMTIGLKKSASISDVLGHCGVAASAGISVIVGCQEF